MEEDQINEVNHISISFLDEKADAEQRALDEKSDGAEKVYIFKSDQILVRDKFGNDIDTGSEDTKFVVIGVSQ